MKIKSIIAIALLAVALITTPCYAAKTAQWTTLSDAAGAELTDYALTSATAVYSEAILIKNNVGSTVTILVTEDKTGDGGDVDISAQYSIDGSNWYTANTTNMTGTLTGEGSIVDALGNTTKWILHTVRIAPYMRYKFDPDANSQITVKYIQQIEN